MYGVERMRDRRKEVADLQSVMKEKMGVYVSEVDAFKRLPDGKSRRRRTRRRR